MGLPRDSTEEPKGSYGCRQGRVSVPVWNYSLGQRYWKPRFIRGPGAAVKKKSPSGGPDGLGFGSGGQNRTADLRVMNPTL